MKIKDKSVNIKALIPQLHNKFPLIEEVCKIYNGSEYEVTITSGNDGEHMKNSLHYKNAAIDIRTFDMRIPGYTANRLKANLGDNFDVIDEGNHIHIEYDPIINKIIQ